ncbi:integrase catalytic domain-containing protein [Trichonephila clavipes]|nr:integrase catalytic domain-containing protein [Trichonephila clavipes]
MIWINPDQRKLQRILWRENMDEPIKTFELSTVTYGTTSAPFLATRTLKQLALDEAGNFPLGSSVVMSDMYIDDVLTGAETLLEAKELKNQLINIFAKGDSEISINDSGSIDSFSDDFDFDISDDENDDLSQARNFYEIDCNNPSAPPPRFAFTNTPEIHLDFDASSGKMQYYEALIDNNLIDLIVHETDRYAEQTIGSSIPRRHSRSKKWEPTS